MPMFARVELAVIAEPELPVRISMDEGRMDALIASMREIGLLQPVGLKTRGPLYEIEFGHRRYLAAVALKWREIPALIFSEAEITEGAAMLAENIEREDITAAEEAVLFAQAQERFGLDEDGLCKRFRRSPDYIGDRLRLLRQDPKVFEALRDRAISFTVARELNKCPDEAHRRYLLDAAMRSGSGARTVTQWVNEYRSNAAPPVAPAEMEVLSPETAAAPVSRPECAICGGWRDPYNLEAVFIHRWELEKIREVLAGTPPEQ